MAEKIETFEQQKKKEYLRDLFAGLFVVAILSFVLRAVLALMIRTWIVPSENSYLISLCYALSDGVSAFALFSVYNHLVGTPLKQRLLTAQHSSPLLFVLGGIGGIGIGIGTTWAADGLISYLEHLGYAVTETRVAQGDSLFSQIFGVIVLSVIPACFQEAAFRGIALHRIKDECAGIGIVFSAFLFAVHEFSFLETPYLFVLGLLLGWLYCKTGSLILTTVIHGGTRLALGVLRIVTEDARPFSLPFWVVLVGLGIAILCFVALRVRFGRVQSDAALYSKRAYVGAFWKSSFLYIYLIILLLQIYSSHLDMPSMHDDPFFDTPPADIEERMEFWKGQE